MAGRGAAHCQIVKYRKKAKLSVRANWLTWHYKNKNGRAKKDAQCQSRDLRKRMTSLMQPQHKVWVVLREKREPQPEKAQAQL